MLYNSPLERKEIKYVLNYNEYVLLVNAIKGIAKYDRNVQKDGKYSVRSLYFDDINNTAYADKKLGLPKRYKFRIRSYNNCLDNMKLEKKYKQGNLSGKESSQISESDYFYLLNGNPINITDSSSNLLKAFYIDVVTKYLKPKIIVDYVREAYVWQIGDEFLRFTFDNKLKWAIDSVDMFNSKAIYINAFTEDNYIFEMKYQNFLPEIISDFLKQLNKFPSGSSKYQLCRKQKENMYWRR